MISFYKVYNLWQLLYEPFLAYQIINSCDHHLLLLHSNQLLFLVVVNECEVLDLTLIIVSCINTISHLIS